MGKGYANEGYARRSRLRWARGQKAHGDFREELTFDKVTGKT